MCAKKMVNKNSPSLKMSAADRELESLLADESLGSSPESSSCAASGGRLSCRSMSALNTPDVYAGLLCTEELGCSPQASTSRSRSPLPARRDFEDLLCTEDLGCSPEAQAQAQVQAYRSRSPLPARRNFEDLLCTEELGCSPEAQACRRISPLTTPAFLTSPFVSGAGQSTSYAVEISEDERNTIARLRAEHEANEKWLRDRGVSPHKIDSKRPQFPDVKQFWQKIDTPSPFRERYTVRKKLGEGVEGLVYEVEDTLTVIPYAAKITYADERLNMYDDILPMEARIMIALEKVPNVPKLLHVFVENAMSIYGKYIHPSIVVVMTKVPDPYCTLMEFQADEQLQTNELRKIFANLAKTLRDIDDCNISHGDLHAGNVLLWGDLDTTLIDFGRSQFKSTPYPMDLLITYAGWVGSPPELQLVHRNYIAELNTAPGLSSYILKKYESKFRSVFNYDRQTVWRVGMMLFEAYKGAWRYDEVKTKPDFQFPNGMPSLCMQLLNKVFVPAESRIGLREMLNHPYFDLTVQLKRR